MKDNGSTVTALAKYNLLVGNTAVWNDDFSDTISVTPISTSEEGYGLQNSIAANYEFDSEGMPLSHTIKGTIAFAEQTNGSYYGYWTDSNGKLLSKYGTSYPANVYDNNSNLYTSTQNYKTYLKNKLGKTSVDARLITYEELINLGCDISAETCKSAPSWVYSTNYWTASAYDSSHVWCVNSNGYFDSGSFDYPVVLGLRPVITISKSEL